MTSTLSGSWASSGTASVTALPSFANATICRAQAGHNQHQRTRQQHEWETRTKPTLYEDLHVEDHDHELGDRQESQPAPQTRQEQESATQLQRHDADGHYRGHGNAIPDHDGSDIVTASRSGTLRGRNVRSSTNKLFPMIALHHDERVVDVFTGGQHGDEEPMGLTRGLSAQA